jgi:UDP-N-acetyl-D-mannosaminuronate dehydrogenase
LAELKQKIETREARIGIVGMGYVGLPLALLFSGERFRVTGFDIAADKVNTLNAGGSYIVRILPAEIQQAQKGRLPRHRRLLRNRRRWTRSSSACPPRSTSTTSPT